MYVVTLNSGHVEIESIVGLKHEKLNTLSYITIMCL